MSVSPLIVDRISDTGKQASTGTLPPAAASVGTAVASEKLSTIVVAYGGRQRSAKQTPSSDSCDVTGAKCRGLHDAFGRSKPRQSRGAAFPNRTAVGDERIGGGGWQRKQKSGACDSTRDHADSHEHGDGWCVIGDDTGTENDCEDADSAYVNAMEEIWAEAEAWVDAEAQVKP